MGYWQIPTITVARSNRMTWFTNSRIHLFHITEIHVFHSEQKCAHFCYELGIVGYGTGAFWDLWNMHNTGNETPLICMVTKLSLFFRFKFMVIIQKVFKRKLLFYNEITNQNEIEKKNQIKDINTSSTKEEIQFAESYAEFLARFRKWFWWIYCQYICWIAI